MKFCALSKWKFIVGIVLNMASLGDSQIPIPLDCFFDPIHTSILSNFAGNMIKGFETKNLIFYYDQEVQSNLVTNLAYRAVLSGVSVEMLR